MSYNDQEVAELLKSSALLHSEMRDYASLSDNLKPLVVAGILIALTDSGFDVDALNGDDDGAKIYDAMSSVLSRHANVDILGQFEFIKDNLALNDVNTRINKTPIKHFALFIKSKIYDHVKESSSSLDLLGNFYATNGDGKTLGIVLTPKHITDLFCELVDLGPDDVVLDPCTGTAGYLVAALHHMLGKAVSDEQKNSIRQDQLLGFELQTYMYALSTANMLVRGLGKSNVINDNFLKQDPSSLKATVGMMNPPYSQGSKSQPELYEVAFTEHLLDAMRQGGRAIVIVPQSSFTGKTLEEKSVKRRILKKHTLEGVITVNKDTFYGVGANACIAIFTAGEPHPADKMCKFIDFRDDGYQVRPHVGLLETEHAAGKKQLLLDVWFDRSIAKSDFCVKTTVNADDEWLHGFYFFNDEIPTEADFEKTVGDYLTFEFSMIMQGRGYLFENKNQAGG